MGGLLTDSSAAGPISATWAARVSQSAQLLYPNNPFAGQADPVATGAKCTLDLDAAATRLDELARRLERRSLQVAIRRFPGSRSPGPPPFQSCGVCARRTSGSWSMSGLLQQGRRCGGNSGLSVPPPR
jgi:hypothetical protein